MPIWSSNSFTSSVFNGTHRCLVIGQFSAILLSQLVCLKGSLRLLCGGLSSEKKIRVKQTSAEIGFFWSAQSQHPESRFLPHLYDPQPRVGQQGCLFWENTGINPGTLYGQGFIALSDKIFRHDLLF